MSIDHQRYLYFDNPVDFFASEFRDRIAYSVLSLECCAIYFYEGDPRPVIVASE